MNPTTPRPAPIKRKPNYWLIALLVFVGVVGIGIYLDPDSKMVGNMTDQERAAMDSTNAANDRHNKIGLDIVGSVSKAERAVKKTLKDPDSYQQISHRAGFVGDNGVYISCLLTYRAKNSFGGYATSRTRVNFNEQMTVISLTPVE